MSSSDQKVNPVVTCMGEDGQTSRAQKKIRNRSRIVFKREDVRT